jgi:hypothetical protein
MACILISLQSLPYVKKGFIDGECKIQGISK